MGLFDGNCNSMFFQMKCDIYYASETQDKYGKMDKSWTYNMTQDCSFHTLADVSNQNNFTFDTALDNNRFFRLETMLYGRMKSDPRKSADGLYRPLSHILITNIRSGTCNDEVFFIETNDEYEGKPTIYEIKTCQPFIGPFNTTEYYKVQLERSDIQEFDDIDIS